MTEAEEIIAWIEKGKGRPLTPSEIRVSLQQGYLIGNLSELPRGSNGCPSTRCSRRRRLV
jgi:hypothetical protein